MTSTFRKQSMRNSALLLTCVLALLASLAGAAAAAGDIGFVARGYGRVSYLLTSPSPEDMGYVSASGDPTEFDSSNKLGLGLGAQALLALAPTPAGTFRVGVDLGAQTLFSDEMDFWYDENPAGDVHKDTEYAGYALGIAEFSPAALPLVVQGGVGLYEVFWTWSQDYPGYYQEESGSGTNFGAMAAVGFRAPIAPKISLPIMFRLDYIARYDGLIGAGVTLGLEFAP